MKQLTFFICLLFSISLLGQVDFPITFEDGSIDYQLDDFGGNTSSIVVDPTDATNMVVQSVRGDNADFFAGTSVGNSGFVEPIPFTATATAISVRVWSPLAGISVKLKVEKADDPTISVETDVTTTVAMQWETLTFDFDDESPGTAQLNLDNIYNKASIFFNFGAEGAAEQTYFWDDVIFTGSGGPPSPDLPITFEDDMLDYVLNDFGGNITTIVTDPTDATNTVAQSVRTADAVSFAGTSVANDGLENPIPFTDNATMMTVRVWSPGAGITVKLKVEKNDDPTISVETDATTTVAMEWETLIFDFSNETTGTAALNLASVYDKISIFFNFGLEFGEEQTYYWDDVEFDPVVGVEVLPAADYGIKVAPNPTRELTTVTLPETITEQAILKLYNSNGQIVQHAVITPGQTTISLQNLTVGMYILSIHTEEAVYTQKVIKN